MATAQHCVHKTRMRDWCEIRWNVAGKSKIHQQLYAAAGGELSDRVSEWRVSIDRTANVCWVALETSARKTGWKYNKRASYTEWGQGEGDKCDLVRLVKRHDASGWCGWWWVEFQKDGFYCKSMLYEATSTPYSRRVNPRKKILVEGLGCLVLFIIFPVRNQLFVLIVMVVQSDKIILFHQIIIFLLLSARTLSIRPSIWRNEYIWCIIFFFYTFNDECSSSHALVWFWENRLHIYHILSGKKILYNFTIYCLQTDILLKRN